MQNGYLNKWGKRVMTLGNAPPLRSARLSKYRQKKGFSFIGKSPQGRKNPQGRKSQASGVEWTGRLVSQLMEEYSSRRSAACQEGLLGEVVPSSTAQGWGPGKERRVQMQSYLNHTDKDDLPVNCKGRRDFLTIAARWEHGAHVNFTTLSTQVSRPTHTWDGTASFGKLYGMLRVVILGAAIKNSFSFLLYISSSLFSTTCLL